MAAAAEGLDWFGVLDGTVPMKMCTHPALKRWAIFGKSLRD
jgi:hypothetical protein